MQKSSSKEEIGKSQSSEIGKSQSSSKEEIGKSPKPLIVPNCKINSRVSEFHQSFIRITLDRVSTCT
jgi:hypothetical protein